VVKFTSAGVQRVQLLGIAEKASPEGGRLVQRQVGRPTQTIRCVTFHEPLRLLQQRQQQRLCAHQRLCGAASSGGIAADAKRGELALQQERNGLGKLQHLRDRVQLLRHMLIAAGESGGERMVMKSSEVSPASGCAFSEFGKYLDGVYRNVQPNSMLSQQYRAARDDRIRRVLLVSDERLRCRRVFSKKRSGATC